MLEAAGKTGDLLVKVLELLEGGEGKLTKKCVHIELSTNLHEVSQCLLNCQLVLTIKNLLRHYAKWVCICVSMVSRHKIRMLVRKDHNQRATLRIFANQLLHIIFADKHTNFKSTGLSTIIDVLYLRLRAI